MQKHVLFFCLLLPGAMSFAADNNNARRANPRLNARDLIRSEYYKLKVYPNPAGLYATFEWDLIHLDGEVGLRILDTYCRELAQYLITTQKDQWLWDTREMPDGIYLYELRTEAQEVLAQGKIVVQK
ncbi:MAG: T9SS type A sorting domain-containing protein [Bacteroidia bacterium]